MDRWFSTGLLKWYGKHKRDLPWRKERNPYKIWLSEIILQQTRVEQGLPYYLRFVTRFPTVKELAMAREDEVLKLWQGLGYYSRARNLHLAAKEIWRVHKGKFPSDHKSILDLKGVGEYTAAAISSFAFGLPHAVVDGNVYRVLSRVFGITESIDTGTGKKLFRELANSLLPAKNQADYNQAIMDFGAMQCISRKPNCVACIFAERCVAYRKKQTNILPKKSKRQEITTRHFYYLVPIDAKARTLLKKRQTDDIWKGLYEFPLYEGKENMRPDKVLEALGNVIGKRIPKKALAQVSAVYKHQLSHQALRARFYRVEIDFGKTPDFTRTSCARMSDYAVSRLTQKFLLDWESSEKKIIFG